MMPKTSLIICLLVLILLAGAGTPGSADGASTLPAASAALGGSGQTWSTKSEEVLSAAKQSGKPIYVYLWARYDNDCIRMSEETLLYDEVAAHLPSFERLAMDATNRKSFPFMDQYQVPYVKLAPLDQAPPPPPPQGDFIPAQGVARWPTSLFLDSQGREIFRVYGYVAGKVFGHMLAQVQELARQWDLLRQEPDSALAEANLGHLYTQLQVFPEARKHLDRALELDPENQTGVIPGVHLDQMILALPEDTAAGKRALQDWQKRNPKHSRLLEAVYFEAVAEVALENNGNALKLLERFEKAQPGTPEYDSLWGAKARELYALIKLQEP